MPPDSAIPDLPLTVIGGFLGAGKTSMVNHLLATATRRIGVLVNDFGSVNVDAALIAAQHGSSIALTNGCVCCSLGDDLAMALDMLRARQPAPEQVIVEASGIADPWRIAQIGLTEPGFALGPLVVVVDASRLRQQLDEPDVGATVRQQLAFAELVVLNKSDRASDLAGTQRLVAGLRPEARQVVAVQGRVAAADLMFEPPPRPRASRLHADALVHPFVTMQWRCPGPLDPTRLRAMLEALPRSVLRIKGFCELGPERAPVLLQYAAERWAITPMAAPMEPVLVVIGSQDMPDAGAISRWFQGALLTV